jgi:catechol 2,3-dioxygenase-like lactoylglutathione lyase family enzyme
VQQQEASMSSTFSAPIPILRIFDLDKAREFYLEYLGFAVDWEHRFEPGFPVYMQVSRGPLRFHLSEHHGDATPGSAVYVYVSEIDALLAELQAKEYRHLRPGILEQTWGMREIMLTDPFGNRLVFGQRIEG